MNKKLIASAILGLGLAASGSASAIVVGGVDFGVAGLTNHIETTTVAETFIDAVGQTLTGYGMVNTVNGNLFYAGADRLYFKFTYDVLTFSPTVATFDNGVINMYMDPYFNLLAQSSATNLDLIDNGTLWAVFNGHNMNDLGASLSATGILTGGTLSFTGAGLADVVAGGLASVQSFLDSNGIPDGNTVAGFADVAITTSGNNAVLNPFDTTTACYGSTDAAGQWCLAGEAGYRGLTSLTTVPEPETLALLGIGLLGLGASLRKRKAA